MQEPISFFHNPVLDTSGIDLFNLATELVDYKVDIQQKTIFSNLDNADSFFRSTLVQSRKKNEVQWAINSLDLILGLVGGFTSVIWAILGLIIQPYEDFKFNNSLVGSIYPTSPQRDEDEPPVGSRKEADETL